MKARLLFICLLSALFTCHVKGQVLKPFIRGGLTSSWFDSPGATEVHETGTIINEFLFCVNN